MSRKNYVARVKKVTRKTPKTFRKGYSRVRFFKWMHRKETLNAILTDYTHLS